jgi:hypothetical protein
LHSGGTNNCSENRRYVEIENLRPIIKHDTLHFPVS